MATKERLTVNIDAAQFEQLQRLAEEHEVSMAWLGRHAIARFLANESLQTEMPFLPVPAAQRQQKRSA